MSQYAKKKDVFAMVVQRAKEDQEFREQLKSAPKETIEKLLKVTIPDNITLVVHEDKKDKVHLVLPPVDIEEIADSDLDNVAGGTFACSEGGCSCFW